MEFRRVVISEFGGPGVLQIRQEPSLPEPGPGQVRVKALAAGLAFTDVMIRKGEYPDVKEIPPFTPGYDLVGEIDKLGTCVSGWKVGQRAAQLTVIGAQAEYICLDAADLIPVPHDLDPVRAVSLVLSYTTAYQMLTRKANVQAGERILVHGAGGGGGDSSGSVGEIFRPGSVWYSIRTQA
ncbi:MAG: alcohol dehydrogenase catalytic domain-containing protein [Anaerolineales bacterium]|nr:alcohol dehydrogenase catalytic domain-containing protein [Anaerolineales bacterium]